MEKKIRPHPSIIEALQSESPTATPLSRIPGFIEKYAITVGNKQKLISILSSIGEQEITHLDMRVEKIQGDNNGFNPELYNRIIQIEGGEDEKGRKITDKLIGLAKQIIASEMGAPVYQILKQVDAKLEPGSIDPSEFENPHVDPSEDLAEDEKKLVQQEQQVRTIMNALITGAGLRIFDKAETDGFPGAINKIDPDLYQAYYDMVYTNLKHMREIKPANPTGANTGSVQLTIEGNESQKKGKAKIKIKADIFPVLLHEMAKGVVEYLACVRYNTMDPKVIQSILSVDSRESEHWMMLLGPQIYKQLFFLIKAAIAQHADDKGLIETKEESDYIIPILSHIIQLPAEQFLSFIEKILRQDQDGGTSIGMITKIIDDIHNQYEAYRKSINAPKMKLTVEQITQQLAKEFNIGKNSEEIPTQAMMSLIPLREQFTKFLPLALPKVQELLQAEGYTISDKKLSRKLAEHFVEYHQKYGTSEGVDSSWLTELNDTIWGFRKSRIEQAAFGLIHEQQKKFPKWTRTHDKQGIYIHPRFPLSALKDAQKNISPQVLEDIDNQLNELIQNGSIAQWLQDHDTMNTTLGNLTERFITLDDVTPECLMEREGDRGLYELTNLEQLKREAGVMGKSCVSYYIDEVIAGTLRVFSLRKGTQSHWTIGYRPPSQTIIQVKGYTNQVKNSRLTTDDPDYQQVFAALKYISQQMPVKKIEDISSAGFIFTNRQSLLSPEEFIELVRAGKLYEVTILSENTKIVLGENDMDILEKLNLKNVESIVVSVGGLTITYHTEAKKCEITGAPGTVEGKMGPVEIAYNQRLGEIVLKLQGLKIDPYFADYDGYPSFGVFGLSKDEAIVQREGKYGIVKRDGKSFKETLASVCDKPPGSIVTGLPSHEIAVVKNCKYGIIKKDEDGMRSESLSCEYDDCPQFGIPGLRTSKEAVVKKGGNFGIIRKGDDEMWTEILPCEYFGIPQFGIHGLSKDEAMIAKGGRLPFGDPVKYGILKRCMDDSFKEALSCEYDEESKVGINGLGPNKAWVKNDGKCGIVKRNDDGMWTTVLPCRYDSIPESNTSGLLPDESMVCQNGKYGIIKDNGDDTWVETLPCDYDITSFGALGFASDEIIVVKDGKYGIMKRTKTGFVRLAPCVYDNIPQFGTEGLAPNEAFSIQSQKTGIIKRNEDGTWIEILPHEYEDSFRFGQYIFRSDEVVPQVQDKKFMVDNFPVFGAPGGFPQATAKIGGKPCFFQRNDAGGWTRKMLVTYTKVEFGIHGEGKSDPRVLEDEKRGVIHRNDDDTWSTVLPCKYDEIPVEWVKKAIVIVSHNNKQHGGIIQKNNEGRRKETLPCEYDKIDITMDGLSLDQAIVGMAHGEDYTYGFVKMHGDGTYEWELDCIYDSIVAIGADFAIVEKDNEAYVMKKDPSDGIYKRFFNGTFPKVLQFGTGGLGSNEAVVRNDGKLAIARKEEAGSDKIITSEYMMKDFGMYGLRDHEARAKKEGQGLGIVRRESDGTVRELLPCVYDAIGSFGEDGLSEDEAMVMYKKKCGIIKRVDGGFKEIIPCEFYSIGTFGIIGENMAWTQKEQNDAQVVIRKTETGCMYPYFLPEQIEQFEFGTFGLSPDESFISPPYPSEDDELSNIYIADGIVRRNDDGSYTTLVSQDWRFFLEAGSYDKSPVFKAARGSGYYDEIERALFHRNANGSREMIDQDRDLLNGPYDQVYPFGKYGCRPDEAFVRTGVFYGVIKKVGKGSSRQIIPPDYCLFFDPSLDFKKKEEVPIKFYPELFDGYRMAVAIGSAGEKYVLYEDDKNSFIKLNLSPKDLLDKYDEFRDFCDRAFECTKKS